jgi:hypothetical protein
MNFFKNHIFKIKGLLLRVLSVLFGTLIKLFPYSTQIFLKDFVFYYYAYWDKTRISPSPVIEKMFSFPVFLYTVLIVIFGFSLPQIFIFCNMQNYADFCIAIFKLIMTSTYVKLVFNICLVITMLLITIRRHKEMTKRYREIQNGFGFNKKNPAQYIAFRTVQIGNTVKTAAGVCATCIGTIAACDGLFKSYTKISPVEEISNYYYDEQSWKQTTEHLSNPKKYRSGLEMGISARIQDDINSGNLPTGPMSPEYQKALKEYIEKHSKSGKKN